MNNQEKKEVMEKTDRVKGWLSRPERYFLYENAKNAVKQGVIIEIGSWQGKSTICLGLGSKAGKNIKIFAIDPHTGSPEHNKDNNKVWTFDIFKENIEEAGISDLIEPVVKKSEDAVTGWTLPVSFLFIDGDHSFEAVERDFLNWEPHIVEGGVIAFHDTTGWPGPRKAVESYVFASKKFTKAGIAGSIIFATKCSRNSVLDIFRVNTVRFIRFSKVVRDKFRYRAKK